MINIVVTTPHASIPIKSKHIFNNINTHLQYCKSCNINTKILYQILQIHNHHHLLKTCMTAFVSILFQTFNLLSLGLNIARFLSNLFLDILVAHFSMLNFFLIKIKKPIKMQIVKPRFKETMSLKPFISGLMKMSSSFFFCESTIIIYTL